MKKNLLVTIGLYAGVGALSVTAALGFASFFLRPAQSQEASGIDPALMEQLAAEDSKLGGAPALPVPSQAPSAPQAAAPAAPQAAIPATPQAAAAAAPQAAIPVAPQLAPPPTLPPTGEMAQAEMIAPPPSSPNSAPAPAPQTAQSPEMRAPSAAQPVEPAASAAPPIEPAPVEALVAEPQVANSFLQSYDYNPLGKRDPFSPPAEPPADKNKVVLLPLQKYDLDQLRLTAIIWNVSRPKAMVRDPMGQVHILTPNAKIGRNNGYLAVIREGEIVVVEPLQDEGRVVFATKLMKLAK